MIRTALSSTFSKIKSEKGLLIVYLILAIVFHRWLGSGFFFNGDTGLLKAYSLQNIETFSFWKGYDNLGGQTVDYPFMTINTIGALPSKAFGLEYNNFTIKLLFFYPYLLLAPLGMYLLAKHLTNNKFASSISSLFYSLSTPIITSFAMGHLNLVIPFAIFPFIFLDTLRYAKGIRPTQFMRIVLMFILVSIYEFRMLYLSFMWFSFLLLYLVIVGRRYWQFIGLWFGVLFSTLLVSLCWILPSLISTKSLYTNPLLQRDLFGNQFMSYSHALAAFHPFWSVNGVQVFTRQLVPLIYFTMPLFAVMALLLLPKHSRDKKVMFFIFFLLFVGILLTKQNTQPFSWIYDVAYNFIPGFRVFRESTKFFQIIIFAYSLLVAYLVKYLHLLRNKLLFWGMLGLMMVNIVFTINPIVSGNMGSMFNDKDVSDTNYQALNNYLIANNSNTYYRLLWMPTAPNLSVVKDSMPHLHYTFFEQILAQGINPISASELGSHLLSSPRLKGLLRAYSVKYIIVPSRSSTADRDFFYWYEPRTNYISELDKLSFLRKLSDSGDNIQVYENYDYMPHISFSPSVIDQKKPTSYSNVDSERISSSEYRVKLYNINEIGYLHFAESYHPDWKVRIGSVEWDKSILNRDYFIDTGFHLKNAFMTNSFEINPSYIKQNVDKTRFTTNKDGSINLVATIYFKPQSYVVLGLIIGIISSALLLLLTLYLHIADRINKSINSEQ